MFIHRLRFASIFIVYCLTKLTNGATLPDDEVEALRSISRTLGKTDWNFDIDLCSRSNSWLDQPTSYYANNVTCDCSFNNNTTCHVIHISFKSQNLSGTLPPNLASLSYLQQIDLTRNYLSGTIPLEWGSSTRLVNISLFGNRLTGSIPVELANLSNLTSLILDNNGLSGALPAALGNLSKIERLHLSSNKFTGEIPEMLARLTSLKDFRISDNNFTGHIPDFIFQNWTNLEQIYMEGSGLSGPIPSINATLENLVSIIISDLDGADTTFSQLLINATLPKLKRLMLRSCNLIGEIPASLGTFTTIKILDLSFNRLSGEIPESLSTLYNLDYLFLNRNNFTGSVPQWILNTKEKMDLSYNNFNDTGESSCQISNTVNLFASIARVNNSGIVPCLRSQINCAAEPLHFVRINCGGGEITVNGITYEADKYQAGPSTFYQSTNWAFSSTGIFLSDDRPDDVLTLKSSILSSNGGDELYTDARVSPSSLTYYAFCLANATYNVSLHFAEIQFTNGETYSSLGKRMFDIYIQGERVKQDFNIIEAAGGAGLSRIERFNANVTDGTLEIHFRWAGKGTTSIPERGIYGPLISGISIFNPGYKPSKKVDRISTAAMAGIVAGATFATLLIVGIFWWNCCYKLDDEISDVLLGDEFQNGMELRKFSLVQIAKMTNNFNGEKLGEGGFGVVYKGYLKDLDTYVAVKRISKASKQGIKEYASEVKIISRSRHKNLVKLIGQCHEKGELILVYELMANGSLDSHLFKGKTLLTWEVRFKIVQDLASALFYLHEEGDHCVLHRDIKASNIMLDSCFNAKLGDFGLARLVDHEKASQTTHLAGTMGYLAPECVSSGKASKESDVYSFGVVALEIACGRRSIEPKYEESQASLVAWVWNAYGSQRLPDVADPKLCMNFDAKQMECLLMVGLWCVHPDQHLRPSIRQTIQVLNFEAPLPKLPGKRPTPTYDAQITSEIQASEPCVSSMSITVPR
ncbi:probable leucine-rich repeat receptor-like serine/threonine-protein kinase At3g14840 isoform X2 [Gossypium arboreum]|uniref:probable leucine-rich repeat receptor-like serine/threonine-protein kinase At3g14840 isoform X2 n=1 Tax=Gossypium arboreum TaxID=29729 RepID=UPI0022F1D4BF|nr:probable leucine-rich repeat receptor-like serine/threonine-protein kinase At3g14840 isoform X2 [Gossypium arboreum]